MSQKQNDLVIGVVDFFSILVPGGIIAFSFSAQFFGAVSPRLSQMFKEGASSPNIQEWVVFILVSYLIGQLLHLIGNTLIQPIYNKTYGKYKSRRVELISPLVKNSLEDIFGNDASPLRRAHAFVNINSSIAASELERFEANAKLFRSLTFVFLVLGVRSLFYPKWWMIVFWLLLSVLAFLRFAERRWKQSVLIYDFFTIIRKNEKVTPSQ